MNLHELPHTNIVKYGTFRLASDPGRSLNFGILDCGWVGQALDRGAIQVLAMREKKLPSSPPRFFKNCYVTNNKSSIAENFKNFHPKNVF